MKLFCKTPCGSALKRSKKGDEVEICVAKKTLWAKH